jgi:orotate phosphoribosyltransferase
VLTSGLHSREYLNKDALYMYPRETSHFCRNIATAFIDDGVEAVMGPVVGGTILSQWTTYHLLELRNRPVVSLYADKGPNDTFVIKRGYEKMVPGRRILAVEDLSSTGKSTRLVVDAVRALGGEVVGAGMISNRGNASLEALGNIPKLHEVVKIRMEMWAADACPLCAAGVPINTDVGHGKAFLEAQKK